MTDSTSTTNALVTDYLGVMLSAVESSVSEGHKGAALTQVAILLKKIEEHEFDDLPEDDASLKDLWRLIELTYYNKGEAEMLSPNNAFEAAAAYKMAAKYVRRAGYEQVAVGYEVLSSTVLLENAVGSIPYRHSVMVESQAATDWMERMWNPVYADHYGHAKAAQGMFHYEDGRPGLGLKLIRYGRQFLTRKENRELNKCFLRMYCRVHGLHYAWRLRLKMRTTPRGW